MRVEHYPLVRECCKELGQSSVIGFLGLIQGATTEPGIMRPPLHQVKVHKYSEQATVVSMMRVAVSHATAA